MVQGSSITMDIYMIQDLLYMTPRIRKIKFDYDEGPKTVYWRFCRGLIYFYTSTPSTASVKQIHNQKELEESFHSHLVQQKGHLKIKYLDDLPPDEYDFT